MACSSPEIMAIVERENGIEFVWKLRKNLLLLATLVASVTYVAGLNPPGGVWSQDHVGRSKNAREHRTGAAAPVPAAVYPNRVGAPVLVSTYSRRYNAFFYSNAAAFVASLVIIVFLLDRRISGNRVGITVLRSTMLLDLLALMAAFAAGSCRGVAESIYVSALLGLVFAYAVIHIYVETHRRESYAWRSPEEEKLAKERRKFLLLMATFATPLTYAAGLAPPGGFWSETVAGHSAGAPLLHDGRYKIRYHVFFYANANSFAASLAVIMLLMSSGAAINRLLRSLMLLVCVLVQLLGLMAAYAAGSCRWITTTVYIVSLVGAVLLYIMLVPVLVLDSFEGWREVIRKILRITGKKHDTPPAGGGGGGGRTGPDSNNDKAAEKVESSRSLLLLLATLAATVTYQAGLSPPGGVWPEGHLNHTPGNPVLHDMHPKRYKAFYHCNTAAFVASVVVIIIIQSKQLSTVGRAALNTVMILDLFGLMGASVAGSSRDAATTIYVSVLAVAVLVCTIAMVVAYIPVGSESEWERIPELEKYVLEMKRKFLLQLAILAATVTYQTGLNPPGGFWPETESKGVRSLTAVDPVLLDHYGSRYQVFFYCNATGFMASVAAILLLMVNPRLYKHGIRSKGLEACVMVGLLGLMGAYAAGSCRLLRTSIYVFTLVAAVAAFLVLQIVFFLFSDGYGSLSEEPWVPLCVQRLFDPLAPVAPEEKRHRDNYMKRKSLMLLSILAASVTYQAGLSPPGGTWGDDDDAAAYLSHAGNPVLLDTNPKRYQAFFYCNATSFVASVVVIMLLLQRTLKKKRGASLPAMQTAMVLDLLGLLGAYAAGSCRDWETSAYVIALVAAVVVFITVYILSSFDVVLGKAKELTRWKYVLNYFGGSNDDGQSAATAPVTSNDDDRAATVL